MYNVKLSGVYHYESSVPRNLPSGIRIWEMVIVITTPATTIQKVTDKTDNKMYRRTLDSSGWTEWVEL